MRREPEGIEHETTPKSSRPSSALQGGLYDHSHSQEYDPYQSAARQMQELLFGTSSGTTKSSGGGERRGGGGGSGEDPNANLRPSTNSAFQKYIPAANIPSTADIMNKLSSSTSGSSGSRRTSWDRETGNNKVNGSSTWSSNSNNKPGFGESHGRMAAKVAKFCHVCGNPFPMPDIRFCCECGVKRLGV